MFRELNLNDLAACVEIINNLSEHYEHPIGGDWNSGKIAQELSVGKGLGAFNSEGELLSFCLFREQGEVLEIVLLATAPREHRLGSMRALIRSIIDGLGDGVKVWLEVHAGNLPAIGLYESLQFRQVGLRQNYYRDGGAAILFEYTSA